MKARDGARALLLLAAWYAATGAVEARVLRVPGEFAQVQSALDSAGEGDVVEIAAGTYRVPAGGLSIRNNRRRFTVRAAPRAAVVLDGGGADPILEFRNTASGGLRPVVFQRLIFRNGLSSRDGVAGALTLSGAQAVFVRCQFRNNRAAAPSTGGGAVKVLAGSVATFRGGSFTGNSSPRRGGAITARDSTLRLDGVRLAGNRVNLPGHLPTASGGALFAVDSQVTIANSVVEGNEAAFAGGALFAFGNWRDPALGAAALLLVQRSTLRANRARLGGAVHAEDHALVTFQEVAFLDNEAEVGGALDGYRAEMEVRGSHMRGNRARGGAVAAGGAISLQSPDFADASTEQGAINRPVGRLTVEDSLLQGPADGAAANAGGCIFATGDGNRLEGKGGVAQDGGLAENRTVVRLRRVGLADCDVAGVAGGGASFGGGLRGSLVDLEMEDSLVVGCDALGEGAGGGGVALFGESHAVIRRTTFAADTARHWGGALWAAGSTIDVAASFFFSNVLSPGSLETLPTSRGAGVLTIPQLAAARPRDAAGSVADSVFSANDGLSIFDTDPKQGPVNHTRYHRNRFFSTRFGSRVYVDSLAAPGGLSPAQLNTLVVARGARASTDKSDGGNLTLGSAPTLGALLAVPPAGAPGEPAFLPLVFGWSGRAAVLAGTPLALHGGVLAAPAPGPQQLLVDGVVVAQTP